MWGQLQCQQCHWVRSRSVAVSTVPLGEEEISHSTYDELANKLHTILEQCGGEPERAVQNSLVWLAKASPVHHWIQERIKMGD